MISFFFQENVSKFVHALSFDFFCGWTCDFSKVKCISIVRKANSTIEQLKFKGHEKCDQILISKVETNFSDQISDFESGN